jgi:hypothetical protein
MYMQNRFFIFLCVIALSVSEIRADEGMWVPSRVKELNIDSMHSLGFNLKAEDLYSITNPSIKDAVVIFGGGCTGEVVSDKGLIFTNHHCGYDAIQELSSVKNDYLKEGFWAKNIGDELACNELTVKFVKSFENVTDSIIPFISDTLTEEERKVEIDKIKSQLETKASQNGKYECDVREFFGGNEYYLIVNQVFTDVRLVGAPPSSIGKFGYDVDNWMWPRHTGDFSVFRVYADSAGNPAPYNKNNIPLKPKKFLSISLKGYNQGDFSMTMGFPGTTKRFFSSYEVKEVMNITNALRIKIRGVRQDIIWKDMMADNRIRIQYSSKYARSSNYWKYSIGQNKGLKRLQVIERKQDEETKFTKWLSSDSTRNTKYGNSLPMLKKIIQEREPYSFAAQYYGEGLYRNIELLSLARQMVPLYEELLKRNPDTILVKKHSNAVRDFVNDFYGDYNVNTDMKVASATISLLSTDLKPEYKFSYLVKAEKKSKGSFESYVAKMYKKTFLTDSTQLEAFLDKPNIKKLASDPAFMFGYDATLKYRDLQQQQNSQKTDYQRNQRKLIDGIRKMNFNKVYSPDANFSMRVSYGKVRAYNPSDAAFYNYYTTLKGIMEKADSLDFNFIVPAKLQQLYKTKDYGVYGVGNEMPVCFISTNDITGGNSGSPVMNANGQLIGIAFDGNWEAMSGDIIYEPELKRTINVDIRYVLFIIDKFAGAGYLLNELQLEK